MFKVHWMTPPTTHTLLLWCHLSAQCCQLCRRNIGNIAMKFAEHIHGPWRMTPIDSWPSMRFPLVAFSGRNVNKITPNQIKMMASRSKTSTGLEWLMYVQMLMKQIVRHPEIMEINFPLSVSIISLTSDAPWIFFVPLVGRANIRPLKVRYKIYFPPNIRQTSGLWLP